MRSEIYKQLQLAEMNMCVAMVNSLTAAMNRELHVLGDWQCDYKLGVREYLGMYDAAKKLFNDA